ELAPQCLRAQLPQVMPVDQNAPPLGIVEPRHQLGEGRLPGPSLADERPRLSSGYVQVDLAESPPIVAAIGERDIRKLDLTEQAPRVERVRTALNVGLGFQEVEDLVQRRHSLLVRGVEL